MFIIFKRRASNIKRKSVLISKKERKKEREREGAGGIAQCAVCA